MATNMTRRSFLKATAGAAAAIVGVPTAAAAAVKPMTMHIPRIREHPAYPDIRKILSDNSIKDMLGEADMQIFKTLCTGAQRKTEKGRADGAGLKTRRYIPQ